MSTALLCRILYDDVLSNTHNPSTTKYYHFEYVMFIEVSRFVCKFFYFASGMNLNFTNVVGDRLIVFQLNSSLCCFVYTVYLQVNQLRDLLRSKVSLGVSAGEKSRKNLLII